MSRKIPQLWARKGGVEVFDIGWGFYVVRFETVSDQERAMFGGPWMVGDHYVVLQNWRPHFRPEDSSLSTLRVWVRLPGLPLEYFDAAILSTIGDKIGKTIRIDYTTLQGNRGNYARICVEVDISKPLLSKYRMRRRVRRIEYEGLHTVCFNCGCYGHQLEACPLSKAPEVEVAAEVAFDNPIFCQDGGSEVRPEVTEEFGPWMLVKRTNRRTKPVPKDQQSKAAVNAPASSSRKGNRFDALNAESVKEGTEVKDPTDGALPSVAPQSKENHSPNIPDANGQSDENKKTEDVVGFGPMMNRTKPSGQPTESKLKAPLKVSSPTEPVAQLTKISQSPGSLPIRAVSSKGSGKKVSLGIPPGPTEPSRKKKDKGSGSRLFPTGGTKGNSSHTLTDGRGDSSLSATVMEVDSPQPGVKPNAMELPNPMDLL
ncbi:hypothetical protein LINPERHAP2_LOCUS16254 [Linum perenne]